MKCLGCDKELEQTPGRRPKLFCGSTCRSKFWYAQNVKGRSQQKTVISDSFKPSVVTKPKKQLKLNNATNPTPETKAKAPVFKSDIERMLWEAKQEVLKNKNK